MSRLFYSDRGRALRTHCEEITRWRWARKTFDLPAAAVDAPADIWLSLWPYAHHGGIPLEVIVNGRPQASLLPLSETAGGWGWYKVSLASVPTRQVVI